MSKSTVPAAEVEEFLSGKLTHVDMVSLQKELRALWTTATTDDQDANHPAVARVCVLNLVLFSTDPDAETSAANILDDITVTHPCRAILAISRPSDASRLEAWVSARCHLPSARAAKQICCEQITVRSEGQGLFELPSVVLPLLVDDLPVFLWWRTSDFENVMVEPFLVQTDRLIVDSSLWTSPRTALQNLHKCMQAFGDTVGVSDINFRRIKAWRHALATSFDDDYVGLSLDDLRTINGVTIVFNGPSPMRPLLLTSWLASRLGMEPDQVVEGDLKSGQLKLLMKHAGRKVNVELVPKPALDVPSGAVTAVKLSFETGRHLEGELVVENSRRSIVIRTDTRERSLALKGPFYSESALIGEELSVLTSDPIYEETVSMAARLMAVIR
jgi:glucose-6-phosphate dehydrogenase assembly protein OpcA